MSIAGRRSRAGLGKDVSERHAGPKSGANERSADFVRDARQSHELIYRFVAPFDLVESERQRMVDQAVDGQTPRCGIDDRRCEVYVYSVVIGHGGVFRTGAGNGLDRRTRVGEGDGGVDHERRLGSGLGTQHLSDICANHEDDGDQPAHLDEESTPADYASFTWGASCVTTSTLCGGGCSGGNSDNFVETGSTPFVVVVDVAAAAGENRSIRSPGAGVA